MTVKRFTNEYFGTLISEATLSPRSRQHSNIHQCYDDPCQRLFNAIGVDSYIRPHRHSLDPKDECLIAVAGLFALVTFSDDGTVSEVVRFGSEKYSTLENVSFGVELSPGTWHTVIALVPNSVIFELKAGPFDPKAAKEPAPWAPAEDSSQAASYVYQLNCLVRGATDE